MHTSRYEHERSLIGGAATGEMSGASLADLIDCTQRTADQGIQLPCRVGDAEWWFAESPTDVEFAKSLCGTCPLQAACLAGALDRSEPWGVWGGELFVGGAIVARKRPRGRPRKAEQTEDAEQTGHTSEHAAASGRTTAA